MVRSALALAVLLPTALAAEAYALLQWLSADRLDTLQRLALLGLHGFAAVVVAEAVALRYATHAERSRAGWTLCLCLSLLLPAVGMLISAVLLAWPPRPPHVEPIDMLSPMEFRKQRAEAELAAEADRGTADAAIEVIGDALKDEDKARRLGAVEALRAKEDHHAVQLLQKSLKNTVFEVRYHAVEALAGINKKFSDRISKTSAALQRDPTPANQLRLAEVYYEYAAMEMEDPSIQRHLYTSAANHFRLAREGDALEADALVRLGTCHARLGQQPEARGAYKAALEQQPGNYPALLGMAEVQFRAREYDQLRETCRQMLGRPDVEQEHFEILALWAGARG